MQLTHSVALVGQLDLPVSTASYVVSIQLFVENLWSTPDSVSCEAQDFAAHSLGNVDVYLPGAPPTVNDGRQLSLQGASTMSSGPDNRVLVYCAVDEADAGLTLLYGYTITATRVSTLTTE